MDLRYWLKQNVSTNDVALSESTVANIAGPALPLARAAISSDCVDGVDTAFENSDQCGEAKKL